MARYLTKDEIEVRVGQQWNAEWRKVSKGETPAHESLLLYKTARTDMKLLDEMFGPLNWKCSYEEIKGNMYCTISVWDGEKGQWVSKSNCGTESNMESEKGEASDAMKRAGFLWGIGRELYTAPSILIDSPNKPRYEVAEIGYNDIGEITTLVIKNKGTVVYSLNGKKVDAKPEAKAEKAKPVEAPKPVAPKTLNEELNEKYKNLPATKANAWNFLVAKLGFNFATPKDTPHNAKVIKTATDVLANTFHLSSFKTATQAELDNLMVGIAATDFSAPEYFIDDGV